VGAVSSSVVARRTVPRPLLAGLAAAAAAVLVARLIGLTGAASVQTFVVIFTAIVVEALPFVLLGAVASAAIEVYVPTSAFARVGRLPLIMQLPAAALGGLALPVCECGSVPVARRLIRRGMHPAAGIAFMLASPILNPVVLASTAIAYKGRGVAMQMVLGRAGLGLVVAIVAGWAIGAEGAKDLLRDARTDPSETLAGGARTSRNRLSDLLEHMASDFFFMGRFVVVGAALAAALQTTIPQSLVSGVATTPVVGSLALMALAYVLSLCSEADAFVAVSFVQFPLASQLAFLVFGPVVDAKLSLLYGATFRRHFVARLIAVVVPVVLAGTLWFQVVVS
jgi:uncharacterized membrane protein YraQ (UPF0718 family)